MSDVTLDEVVIKIEGEASNITSSLDKLATTLDIIASKLDKSNNKLNNNVSKMDKISKAIKSLGLAAIFQKLTSSLGGLINKSADYIENLNLFYVSLGKNAEEAKKFADNFSSALSVDPSNVYRYLGLFNSLIEGFGVSSDKAYIMSKNLTQLSYDFASFYNLPIDQAMQKLKSGISGEIEPMRAIGVALDQATLQATAYSLGINTLVSDMTRAQKTQLLYYQIMKTTSQQQQDMGRTLLSPANALRVAKEQFTLLGRAIGNIFIPMLVSILPYINYITKALTNLAQKIAGLFGFKLSDYVQTDIGDISTGIGDIGDSADKTSKKMKNMLRDFDELHVVDFDTGSASSGATGGTGGELDIPLIEYDALGGLVKTLDNVKGKLDFVKDAVIAVGIAIGTYFTAKKIFELIDALGLLTKNLDITKAAFGIALFISGFYLQYKGTEKLLDGDISLYSILETFLGTAAGTLGIVALINSTKTGRAIPLLNKIRIGAGIMLVLQGLQVLKEGIESGNIKEQILGVLETGAGITAMGGSKLGIAVSLALIVLTVAFDMKKWAEEYSDKWRKELYDNKPELNLGEWLNVNLTAIGEGAWKSLGFTDRDAEELGTNINDFFLGIETTIAGWTDNIEANFNSVGADIDDFFTDLGDNIATWFSDRWNDLVNWGKNIGNNVGNWFSDRGKDIENGFSNIKNSVSQWFSDRWNDLSSWGQNTKTSIVQWFTDRKNDITSFFSGVKSKLIEAKDNAINTVISWKDGIVEKVVDLKNGIGEKFSEIRKTIEDKVRGIPDWIKTNLVDKIKEKFQNIASSIGEFISGSVKGAINGAFAKVEEWINGFISGLNGAIDTINNIPGVSIGKINRISLPRFEDGGFPNNGDLFIANESGPEWVGSMNGKTTVANSDQISEGVRVAAYQGMKQALTETKLSPKVYVNIGNKEVYSGYAAQKRSDSNMYGVDLL